MESYLIDFAHSFMGLISPEIVKAMASLLFIVACCSISMVMISIGGVAMSIASLIDRISVKESKNTEKRFLDKLMFWKKDAQNNESLVTTK